MRYHLVTLGCPKNVADSEQLERLLQRSRHEPVDDPDAADVLLVNTCGFIDQAKEESINAVLALAARKRPGQRLVVAGCLTQLHGPELAREIPEIDHVFGVEQWERVAAVAGPVVPLRPVQEPPYDIPETTRPGPPRVSAYLKISDGCNAPCTFCIIPTIKGRFRSLPPPKVVEEARRLVALGARELVLVAQDSTAYGEDLGLRDGLAGLLELLSGEVPPDVWIRVMYAYPGRVSERLIRAMAEVPQVVHYLDMPLQHGSPAVLRRMHRPSKAVALRNIRELRAAMPDMALRTAFIVGYPGETEEEFQELLDFVEEARFDRVGVFTYSPQAGTPAAREAGRVPERVKRQRRRRLMELQRRISLERNREQVGRELDVLVESLPGEDALFVGRSYRDAPEVDGVVVCRGRAEPGQRVRVRVTEALEHDLVAEPV